MNTPPPLFRAIAATTPRERQDLGLFTTKDAAKDALNNQLEEWHESIAFESDRHHKALDDNFNAYSRIIEER